MRFKYIVFRGDVIINEYNTGNSTITGQANALGAIAVGAARYDRTPPFAGPLTIESFSSIGGTFVNNVLRNKPELVAPDGVNSTVNLGVDYDNNSFSNFFGTSAAAPHAAAVAALIMEGRSKYLNQPLTTPAEIRAILQNSATDMNSPGFDLTSGYGFINADSAMRTFASPDPAIVQLVIPDAITPGQAPFTLTVRGINLSSNSVITFRGVPLPTTVLNSGEASALIPAFTGNPPISVYTPPISPSNLDGGYSDTLYFFDQVKKIITITTADTVKKYAEQLPSFTARILVDGLPLDSTSLTGELLGLASLSFVTQATSNSNVGTYIVTPSRTFNPADSTDVGLLEQYTYLFGPGNLSIEKMPLLVTPVDKTINHGQHVGDITFNYAFDQTNVPDPAGTTNLIRAYHQAFLPNNALAVVNGGSALTEADLLNLNMMASFKAVNSSRKFLLENDRLVPAGDSNAFNIQYLLDISSQSILAYKNSPGTASFINAYPGTSSKAVLSVASLDSNTGRAFVNGSLVQMVNGSLVQMVNSTTGPLVPISNGSLVQIVNGSLVQLVNGEVVPIPNGSLVQLVNGSLVQLVNGSLVQLVNGSLVQLVNGSLVQMVNGSLVQLVNGQEVPIINGSLVQLVNGSLVQMVNGVPVLIPNGSLVQLVNGSLVQLVNGSLVQMVNGSLVQLVNGSLVQLVNGSLVQIVNGNALGTTSANNNTAVIIDQSDVDFQTNWIGPMFGINMITGLDAGPQRLVPGVLVNDNFEISYGLGKVNILPAVVTITPTPGQHKVYGSSDPAFTFSNDAGLRPEDFTGSLGRETGSGVGEYAYTLGTLTAGVNYTLQLSEAAPVSTFKIRPKPVCITPIAGQSKVYGDTDPIFTFTSNAGLKREDFSGALAREAGNNVGKYAYTIGSLSAGKNFELSLIGANKFTITRAPLQVCATNAVICKGDPLPTFKSIITGLKNGDDPTVSYKLNPVCAGQAGVYTIIPLLDPFSNVLNYDIRYTNGKLYINPKGAWTKMLQPTLDCVEEISPGRFIAHFSCKNENATPLFIAAGEDNKLSSAGSFETAQQPSIFMPGITTWNVPFDGNALKWELKTYEGYHKVSSSALAAASSNRCNYFTSTRSAGTSVNAKRSLQAVTEIIPESEGTIYPNPANSRARVYISNKVITQKGMSCLTRGEEPTP
ncbi:MAG: MBG domain-containing protein [Ferruginibacter sp.]